MKKEKDKAFYAFAYVVSFKNNQKNMVLMYSSMLSHTQKNKKIKFYAMIRAF